MSFALQRHALISDESAGCPVPLAVEPLTAAEAAPLAEIFAAMEPWSRYPIAATALAAYLGSQEPGAPRFAIKAGDQTVGVAGLRLEWLRGPYLQFLGLVPQAQGFGMGGLVMAWLEREARAGGARNLWVCASAFNDGALAYYEARGFTRATQLPDLVADGIDEVLLRKRLP